MQPFHNVLMWQSRMSMRLSIVAPLGCKIQFLCLRHLRWSHSREELVNSFNFAVWCPSRMDGSKKVTWLKVGGWQGSKISNTVRVAQGKRSQVFNQSTWHWTSHTVWRWAVWDNFLLLFHVLFLMRFSWKMCTGKQQKCAAKLAGMLCLWPLHHLLILRAGLLLSLVCHFCVDDSFSGVGGAVGVTNCWCTQADTSPQYTSFSLLIPGKSLESKRGHFGQKPIKRHLHSLVMWRTKSK